MSNHTKDGQKDPITHCSTKDAGALFAEVVTFRSGLRKPKKESLQGVDVSISGATEKDPQKTGANGRTAVFDGLVPGSYTVTIDARDEMKEYYDLVGATTWHTNEVKKSKTQSYYFEVPWFWVDHEVKYPDGKTFATGIEWVLYHKKPQANAPWTEHSKGTTGKDKVSLDKVPRGRYKLALKGLFDPVWGADKVVLDTPIDLQASVSGFDVGTAGTFGICDAHAPDAALCTLDATVSEDGPKKILKATWTPAEAQLTNLKSTLVVFKASVSGKSLLSGPLPMFNKEKYEVVDQDGAKVDTQLEIRFSGGHLEKKTSSNGTVEVEHPWNQTIERLNLPGKKGSRVGVDEGGIPVRRFSMPA